MSLFDMYVFANPRQEIIYNLDHFGEKYMGVECIHSIDQMVLEMCSNWELEIGLHDYVVRIESAGFKVFNRKPVAFVESIKRATAVDAQRFLEWCDKDTEGNSTEFYAQWEGNPGPLLQWFEEYSEPFPITDETWVMEAVYYTKLQEI